MKHGQRVVSGKRVISYGIPLPSNKRYTVSSCFIFFEARIAPWRLANAALRPNSTPVHDRFAPDIVIVVARSSIVPVKAGGGTPRAPQAQEFLFTDLDTPASAAVGFLNQRLTCAVARVSLMDAPSQDDDLSGSASRATSLPRADPRCSIVAKSHAPSPTFLLDTHARSAVGDTLFPSDTPQFVQ